MKKWNEPKLVELNLGNTKGNICNGNPNAKTPWDLLCYQFLPNGEKAYTPGSFLGICIYHGENDEFCNYPGKNS